MVRTMRQGRVERRPSNCLMDKSFLIDAQAREEKMDRAARHLLPQEKAPPVLNQIRGYVHRNPQRSRYGWHRRIRSTR